MGSLLDHGVEVDAPSQRPKKQVLPEPDEDSLTPEGSLSGDRGSFMPWVEKYRPKHLRDVIGHGPVVKRFEAFVKSKDMPHILLSGSAGIGKTTSVLALARELYGDRLNECYLEANASDERGIDVIRGKIKDFARTLPLADVPWKIIFLDEADALTSDAQHALRRTMEKFSATTRFALSCNYSSKIIEPIQSRCAVFRFSRLSEEELRLIIERVAQGEGLKLDKAAEDAVLYVSDGDGRKAINVLQGACALNPHVTADEVYRVSSRARPAEVDEMVRLAWQGKFTEARKKLDHLFVQYGMNGEDIITQIYREIANLDVPEATKVELIDKVGEYNFRLVEGAHERLQLEALLAQIMLIGSKHPAPAKISQ